LELDLAGWTEASLVDVLGEVSFTIWFCGCNFRCPWCQNAPVVLGTACRKVRLEELLEAIEHASLLADYVQATGGEPTLQAEGLEALFGACKDELTLKTSLDTNGALTEVLGRLLEAGLVDHVAMDVKAPLDQPEKYARIAGLPASRGPSVVEHVRASVSLALDGAPFVELRTTFVPTLHTREDILAIATELAELGLGERPRAYYVLQQFWPGGELIDPSFAHILRPSVEFLTTLAKEVKEKTGLQTVYVRTQEAGVLKV